MTILPRQPMAALSREASVPGVLATIFPGA